MEKFFYDYEFYGDIEDIMFLFDFEDDCSNVPDDWQIKCMEAKLEPVFQLTADWIYERIDEERFTEDGEEADAVFKLLEGIDFRAVNEKMPRLYYPNPTKTFFLTKQDLLEYCQ